MLKVTRKNLFSNGMLLRKGLWLPWALIFHSLCVMASPSFKLPEMARKVIDWSEAGGEERLAKELEKESPTVQAAAWYFLAQDHYSKLKYDNGLRALRRCLTTPQADVTIVRACQVRELYELCFSSLWSGAITERGQTLAHHCLTRWEEYKPSLSWVSQRFSFPSRGYELSLALMGQAIWKKNYGESVELLRTFGDKWSPALRDRLLSLLLSLISEKSLTQKLVDVYYFKLLTPNRLMDAHAELLRGYKIEPQAMQLRIKKWIANHEPQVAWQELELFERIFSLGELTSRYLRASWYFYNYQFEECDKQLAEALKLSGKSAEGLHRDLLQLQVLSFSRQGRLAEAARASERLMSVLPKVQRATVLFDQGFFHFQAKNFEESRSAFERLLKLGRGDRGLRQEAKWYLGLIAYLQEDYLKAAQIWKELIQQQSYREQVKVWYWLAQVYIKNQQLWLVKTQLEKLVLPPSQFLRASALEQYYSILSYQQLAELAGLPSPLVLLAQQGILTNGETYSAQNLIDAPEFLSSTGVTASRIPSAWLKEVPVYDAQAIEACRLDQLKMLLDLKVTFIVRNEISRCRSGDVVSLLSQYHMYVDMLNWAKVNNYWYSTLLFPEVYPEEVEAASRQWGVDPSLIRSIIRAESFYDPEIESPAYAKGLMQLMAQTAQQVARLAGVKEYETADQLFQPQMNILLGAAYLRRLLSQFNDQLPLAIAAYNAGPHRVQTWLYRFGEYDYPLFVELIPFNETRNYVKKVLSYFYIHSGRWPNYFRIQVPESVKIPALKESWEQL
jgi:TolA-binding protein